jgi:hypothetical protein
MRTKPKRKMPVIPNQSVPDQLIAELKHARPWIPIGPTTVVQALVVPETVEV